MIRPLFNLLRSAPEPRRLVLFAVVALAAVVLGFGAVSPAAGKDLITAWGYYYILGVFVAFVFFAWRVAAARSEIWRGWLRRPGWPGCMILVATVFALGGDPVKHKILYDEYVLQGTALQMHATKEIATVVRAYDIAGSWVPITTFLDKRPYFFPFVVSLVHDLTGYRIANIFVVNAGLTFVLFGLTYWLGRVLAGRGPALLAVGLLATLPLIWQNATGAGMEIHNLAMIALVMAVAVLWLRAPSPDRLSLLVLGAVLLAQSRYESALFVAPVAVLIVVGWWRAGQVLLSWPAMVAPLLLVPRVWHNRFLDASPQLWQLNAGQSSRFSLDYLEGNLAGAWSFFFNLGPAHANSFYLSLLGALGLLWGLGRAWRRARRADLTPLAPAGLVVIAFGAGIVANLALIMFYYWSRLDDTMAARFALPMCLLFVLSAAWAVSWCGRYRAGALRVAALGLGAWLFTCGWPAMAVRLYTDQNMVMKEVEWEHEVIVGRHVPVLFITNKSTIPFVLWRVPTILNLVGRQRGEEIKYHMGEGTFREVIVAQALRPTTVDGNMGVDPDDLMPPSYRLEMIAEKRFGGRIARLSRIVAIDETPRQAASVPGGGMHD